MVVVDVGNIYKESDFDVSVEDDFDVGGHHSLYCTRGSVGMGASNGFENTTAL